MVVRPKECLCGQALVQERPLQTPRVDTSHGACFECVNEHGQCALPLRHQDNVVGVLNLYLAPGKQLKKHEEMLLAAAAEVFALILSLERKNRELSIRKQEYRAALEQAADAILSIDMNGIIRYANPTAYHVFGYRYPELRNQPVRVLVPEESRMEHDRWMSDDLLAGTPRFANGQVRQVEAVRKDGKRITLELTAKPSYDPSSSRITIVARDITERLQQQQQQIEHAQRLESLGVLAGGIAHDFNNILAGIMGNASLARMKMEKGSPASENLKKIEVSCRRASTLCAQMLAYAGKGSRSPEPLNMNTAVYDIASMIEVSLGKQVQLEMELSEELPLIEADEAQVEQIILNLITNANEAIGNKVGHIRIRTGVMQADREFLAQCINGHDHAEGSYVFIEVSDDGCGMDVETRRRLFEPFFTTKRTGRGLGMSALLGIVDQHGGAIHLESEPGRGSTFRILFPAAEPASDMHSESAEAGHPACFSGKALVVDDEPVLREVASGILSRLGLKVITAEDGQAGLDAFERHRDELALVLMDMNMPRMNGAEACRRMKALREEVPIILASGYGVEETAGLADAFLGKPFTHQQLVSTLDALLNG